jgi:ketosteroid isomerase-like protein
MSQGNVERVRSGYEAFARGDLDGVLEVLDPEIEVHPPPEFLGKGASYHGHAGFLAYSQRWLEPWEEYRLIPEQFIEAGDRVIAANRAIARGKGSGVEVETRMAHSWTMREGKAVRMEVFRTAAEALGAAGLSE